MRHVIAEYIQLTTMGRNEFLVCQSPLNLCDSSDLLCHILNACLLLKSLPVSIPTQNEGYEPVCMRRTFPRWNSTGVLRAHKQLTTPQPSLLELLKGLEVHLERIFLDLPQSDPQWFAHSISRLQSPAFTSQAVSQTVGGCAQLHPNL